MWQLLPEDPIYQFVLAPLPKEIITLTQKFPELGKTFQELGITKITDLGKLRATPFILPGLTETASLSKGVPLAELIDQEKENIPCGIVFAKAGNRLIDFSIVCLM